MDSSPNFLFVPNILYESCQQQYLAHNNAWMGSSPAYQRVPPVRHKYRRIVGVLACTHFLIGNSIYAREHNSCKIAVIAATVRRRTLQCRPLCVRAFSHWIGPNRSRRTASSVRESIHHPHSHHYHRWHAYIHMQTIIDVVLEWLVQL